MFSERFMSAVGVPPARYLSRWRMHLASIWLRNNRRTVSEVAAELGYESDASFSRAFKRYTGLPPSAVRQLNPHTRPSKTRTQVGNQPLASSVTASHAKYGT
jgi:AraC-like DNA-binding protein